MFREQLLLRALAALSEVANECPAKPAPADLGLRFILAYTFVAAGSDPKRKWIWNSFWESATAPRDPMKPMDDYLRHQRPNRLERHLPRGRLPAGQRALHRAARPPQGAPARARRRQLPDPANDEPGDGDAA